MVVEHQPDVPQQRIRARPHRIKHLFPNLSHAHYLEITRVIAKVAAEAGMPYHVTTLPRMVRSHFRFLKAMGAHPDTAGAPATGSKTRGVVPSERTFPEPLDDSQDQRRL